MPDQPDFQLLNDYDSLARQDIFGRILPDDFLNIVQENINPVFNLRPYQIQAFQRFYYHIVQDGGRKKPTHLLFHMATGSGKTLIMAGCILYLYEQGYRNFIFFVNSTNIIEKTKNNFLNGASNKYLFADSIHIGDKQVRIKEVSNFQGVNPDDINIHFTTIQALHSRMNKPRENAVTYDDFEGEKVVLLSDEAHHLNVDTKRAQNKNLNQSEFQLFDSWESTAMRIFNASPDNLLLEFTATVDFEEPAIAEKYKDKLIYDYPLLSYYLDKYSKEVQVLQSSLDRMDRALQAIVLSQYRQMVFADNQLLIKPVVMFKANRVTPLTKPDESKVVSSEFREDFKTTLERLAVTDLQRIRDNTEADSIVQQAFQYFQEKGTSLENLVLQLQEGFSDEKCISVDSESDRGETQVIVNTLEADNNLYRAVFAVEALNEGWDVLNLFDIVRLYDTRDARSNRPGKKTIAEAQLIGRGARYCPFQLGDGQPKDQRKFDDDLQNPLRVCEELYYHITYDTKHRYITELRQALDMVGIKPSNAVKRELKLKDNFKESQFYLAGTIFLNEQVKNENSGVHEIPQQIRDKRFSFSLAKGEETARLIREHRPAYSDEDITRTISFIELGQAVLRKATQRFPFYEFVNLQRFYPHLKSMSEFIASDKYLADIKLELTGTEEQLDNLNPDERLRFAIHVLNNIAGAIEKGNVERYGTKTFVPKSIKDIFNDKELQFNLSPTGTEEIGFSMKEPRNTENYLDLSKENWYAFNENYGTSEEKQLVKFIKPIVEDLSKDYDTIYLLRNERHFKLFNFDDERVVEPDFVLFLGRKVEEITTIYQLFIEPKGSNLIQADKWKEEFFARIEEEFEIEQKYVFENRDVKIIGLPFYNKLERQEQFGLAFDKALVD